MASEDVPKLIANALRFLATGFDMATSSGVAGSLRRVDGGTNASPYATGLPKTIRVVCSDEALQFNGFHTRMPVDFLIDSIGQGSSSTSISERAGSAYVRSGQAAGDGSETYRLRRVEITCSDVPGGFAMSVRMQLGEPILDTFVYAAPVDRSAEIYEATFEVAFKDVFKFLFPVTKAQAEAVTARIFEKFRIQLEMPGFHVTR